MNEDDTIAAIATPLGEGGLAVIRVSGREALPVVDKVFQGSVAPSKAESHTIVYGRIAREKKTIDEVMIAVLRAPRTFTREDTVEISCHGGILPAKLVLDAILESGARLANPGEFTKRAFLNGRIDLAQAEAVADIIHSQTELALTVANEQLAGKLSAKINDLRDDLIKTLAHIEAHIDFPDEDISPDTHTQLLNRLQDGVTFMARLLRTADEGEILRRGIRTAIVGRPNAGKSSLLNHLLGHDRAIVSAIPGTTRDTIEETANIRGIPIVFIDTAGLRESGDEIELEGMRRSHHALSSAELVLHVLDGSEAFSPDDANHLANSTSQKRILIRNKSDLPEALTLPDSIESTRVIPVSCKSGDGIEPLKDVIKELVWSGETGAEMLEAMINSRHQAALKEAQTATEAAINALKLEESLELVAVDLRIAVNRVGEIVGKTSTEDLLDSIFSQFCLGK